MLGRCLLFVRRERLLKNLLSTARLFRPLTTKQRQDLVRRFTNHEVEAGASILRPGEPVKGLFVVLSGEVEVSREDWHERCRIGAR